MKKKNLLMTAVATLGLTTATMAQNNCDLINSATFTVPNTNQTTLENTFTVVQNNTCVLDTGQWIYVAYTKNTNNVAKLYKNGVLQATGNYLSLNYFWNRIDIGAEFYTTYCCWFNGRLDEMRVSNSERTGTEILNHFNSNSPFSQDANTIGLYHFDENTGTTTNGIVGPSGAITNAQWTQGKFGSALNYNGQNARTQINLSVPTSNYTMEFWVYIPNYQNSRIVSTYGGNSNSFGLDTNLVQTSYNWSTGATGNSVTINPTTLPYIWVTDGNCTDTIWFNSQSATIYDTTYVTVTDTLIINTTVTGINPPSNLNTIKVFPNPASTHITIDYGNFAIMNGYQLRIENSVGQEVFQTNISQQSDYLNLDSWGGNGLYFVHIVDPQGNTIDIRKIVLQ